MLSTLPGRLDLRVFANLFQELVDEKVSMILFINRSIYRVYRAAFLTSCTVRGAILRDSGVKHIINSMHERRLIRLIIGNFTRYIIDRVFVYIGT